MAKSLTALSVKSLRPRALKYETRDGSTPGLYLTTFPSGNKSWVLRFRRPGGKPGKLTLGVFNPGDGGSDEPIIGQPLTLAEARAVSMTVHRQRAFGVDVISERRKPAINAVTFEVVARQFIAEHALPRTRRGVRTSRVLGLSGDAILKNSLMARWSDKPITSITPQDIFTVIDESKRQGVPGLEARKAGSSDARGRLMARILSKLFAWAMQHRKVQSNPCIGQYVPPPAASRDRVLSEQDLRKLWTACDQIGPPFGPVFQLLILTGQRLNECAGIRRSELDGSTWTIPSSRTKNKRVHIVPLPRQAMAILASMPDVGHDLFFTTTGTTAVSGWSVVKKRLDGLMQSSEPWRTHDLRRTMVTHNAERGVAPHLLELIINHVSGSRGGVAGIYNRSQLMNERRAILQAWADHIIPNVVSLLRRTA
jgi:integrase